MTEQMGHPLTTAEHPLAVDLRGSRATAGVEDMTRAVNALAATVARTLQSDAHDLDALIQLYGDATTLRRIASSDPDLSCDHGLRRAVIVLSGKIQALRSRIIVEETCAAWPPPLPR